jgi:hypothetical protein
MPQILESQQVGRKLLIKGQLQMDVLFAEVFKPKNLTGPSSSINGSI